MDTSKLGIYTVMVFRTKGCTTGGPEVFGLHVIASSPVEVKVKVKEYLKEATDIDFVRFNNMKDPRPLSEPISTVTQAVDPAQYDLIRRNAQSDRTLFYI